ncbi:MAG TPA: hypothetical protein VFA35_06750 [Burkholderiaceae bacterium]|nr:hypothetical protein [Burkholderiaceae bacterium]
MQSQERNPISAFLEGKVAAGASSQDIAESVAAAFDALDRALTPIVGQRGVAALYERSVHLARKAHPWLPVPQGSVPSAIDLRALVLGLAQRTAADAGTGGAALLQTFHDLLTHLIGASLTERLLRSVWANFLSGPSAGDTTR